MSRSSIGICENKEYRIDGQHRSEAFRMSGRHGAYVDVRFMQFDGMDEMGDQFVELNGMLSRMRPDDILRGLDKSIENLRIIRLKCKFVGYGHIRRTSSTTPVLSMSVLLTCLGASQGEVPLVRSGSAESRARALTTEETEVATEFLEEAIKAWGRDVEYGRLWGALNLTICLWIYRNMVLSQSSSRTTKLTNAQFRACLMSLSAKGDYLGWLIGRSLTDNDRGPAYSRIKESFARRYKTDTGKTLCMPSPVWASQGRGIRRERGARHG